MTKNINWEEQFDKNYKHRLTFLTEGEYYWNRNFYDGVKEFIRKVRKQAIEEFVNKLLQESSTEGGNHISVFYEEFKKKESI